MDLEQFRPDADIAQFDDSELLMAHLELHSYWWEIEQGRSVEDWDAVSLIEVHRDIRQELEARNLPHGELNDLDHETVPEELAQADSDEVIERAVTIIEEMMQGARSGRVDSMTIEVDTGTGNLRFEVESMEQGAYLDQAISIAKGERERVGDITAPVHQVIDVEEMA